MSQSFITLAYADGGALLCLECGQPCKRHYGGVANNPNSGFIGECCLPPRCPYCGERGGRIFEYDFGVCSETGYHDAGERCTMCAPGRPE